MIKHILFDLDGTILDFNKGEADAFKRSIIRRLEEEDKDGGTIVLLVCYLSTFSYP